MAELLGVLCIRRGKNFTIRAHLTKRGVSEMVDVGDIFAATFVGFVVIALVFLFAIIGAVFGALAGYFVGFTPFGDWILGFLNSMDIHTNMVDFGACCGFVGGFFHRYSGSGKE